MLTSHRHRIAVSGAPGSGRRAVGTLLELERGFRHVCVDDPANLAEDLGDTDIVVTCTAPLDGKSIASLRALGFELVRLGRPRARHGPWRAVDPLERDGSFRPVGVIAAEILAPARVRPNPSCRPRTRGPAAACQNRSLLSSAG